MLKHKLFKQCLKLLVLGLMFSTSSVMGSENVQNEVDTLASVKQKVEITQNRLHYAQSQMTRLEERERDRPAILANKIISKEYLFQARLQEAKAEANMQSIRISLVEVKQSVETIEATMKRLGNTLQVATLAPSADEPIKIQIQKLKDELSFHQTVLSLEQSRVKILNKLFQVAKEEEKLNQKWLDALIARKLWQEEQAELNALEQQKTHLQQSQHAWLVKLSKLNQRIQALQEKIEADTVSAEEKRTLTNEYDALRVTRVEAEEQSNLDQAALMLLARKKQVAVIAKQHETTSVYMLRQTNNLINTVLSDLAKLKKLHSRKLGLIDLRQEIAEEQFSRDAVTKERQKKKLKLYNQIKKDYVAQDKQTDQLIATVKTYQTKFKQALSKAMARRQVLPSFSMSAWESLAGKIADIPGMAINAMDSLKTQLTLSMKSLTPWNLGWLLFLQAMLVLFWLEGRTLLGKLAIKIKDRRTALGGETLFVFVELLKRNWLSLLLTVAFFSWFIFSEVPFKSYSILLWLILVWTAFKWGIGLMRLTLLEGTAQITGHDVTLYRGLKWSMILGGIIATLTVLAHQLPVTYEVSDFFNRLLMIFFIGLGLFLLIKLRVVPILLAPHLEKSRPYVRHLIKTLSLFVPLAMLCNAVIGLLGYIQLAWTISKYEMVFLLVMTLYMLARGLIIDAMATLASFTIRHMRNGWLWTEAILKPLDRLIRLFLLIAAISAMTVFYGWHENPVMVDLFHRFFKLKLFDIGESPITPLTLIQFYIISIIIYWTARWSREFAYRWLFARKKDVGLRNSMAALFQYGTVMIAIYISLQALEIDWTGLKFVLVAFAAGIGFGLRDTANNFVSGVLLLIERPVRRGDLVTIGDHEGEVTHVGIRSLVLHTWEHMDVLVPNSEIFSKSFVNWTRQDPIIRSTIKIKVQRDDDPRRVRALIEQILVESPDVLSEPEPQVLFVDVSDDLINIEVRYHINLQNSGPRVKVRSDLLFSIWRTFKEAGVRAPYPQQDIHLRSLPDGSKNGLLPPFEPT